MIYYSLFFISNEISSKTVRIWWSTTSRKIKYPNAIDKAIHGGHWSYGCIGIRHWSPTAAPLFPSDYRNTSHKHTSSFPFFWPLPIIILDVGQQTFNLLFSFLLISLFSSLILVATTENRRKSMKWIVFKVLRACLGVYLKTFEKKKCLDI